MRKDLVISLLGHLALVALIIIINPATTRLGMSPEVMTVDLGSLPAAGPEEAPPLVQEEEPEEIPEPPQSPEQVLDSEVEESFAVRSTDTLQTIIEEKEPEPEPEPERKPAATEAEPPEEVIAQADTDEREDAGAEEVEGGAGLDVATGVSAGTGTGYGEGGGSFNLPYNLGLLIRKIERVWRNPVSSANRVSCTVYFQVGRDGSLIGEPVIEKSSGISIFDQEAIYSIRRVDRFPEFPSNFEYDYIGIHMDFAYVP
jgi:outer membrane biosynthesis protein TonB